MKTFKSKTVTSEFCTLELMLRMLDVSILSGFKFFTFQKSEHLSIPMKRFLLVVVSICFYLESDGQSQINGNIQDISGKPIAFANVMLLSPIDSLVIKGSVSQENGNFLLDQIEENNYLLSVSLLGYNKYIDQVVVESKSTINLNPIVLLESEDELEEVQVTAQLPLYERQIDRMVINVQASITAAGNTVLEVLQRSPGVIINRQSNSIMLNGKSGVTIMINNRIQRLPMEVVFQMMDGMSAANIEKIELITNPPAKYDAEGTGGIIHLIMAESTDMGTNGNFGLTAGFNAREILQSNFNLNHRKEKFSFFVDYSIMHDPNIQTFDNNFQIQNPNFTSSFNSFMNRPHQLTTQSFRTGLELDISNKTKVGSIVSAFRRYYNMDASSVFDNKITPDSSSFGTIVLNELNIWNHFTSNIHITHRFNPKSDIRLDLDYNWSKNNNPSNYDLDFNFPEISQSTKELINMTKVTPIYMKVAGLDYSYQHSASLKFEGGVKGTFSTFENEVEVLFTRQGVTTRDEELSIFAFLEEDILAAYVSADWQINETNHIKGGIRFENTRTFISTATEIGVVDRNFDNFFPSIFYKKTINNNLSLNLSYSRRIQRPTFNDLAPFVFFMDPNLFFSGNPALLPSIIDGLRSDFNIKRANVSLEYNRIKNPIAMFQPEFDPVNNRQILRSQNLDYQKLYSFNISLPWIINDWWDIQLNTGSLYTMLRTSHFENNENFEFFNFMANVNTTFKLPKNYSLEANGSYNSRMNFGVGYLKPIGNVNLGVQKKLNNDKGTFRLSFNDIFYSNIVRINSTIPEFNIISSFIIDPHMQAVRLNYTRSFGNKKLRGVNIKSGSEDVQERIKRDR